MSGQNCIIRLIIDHIPSKIEIFLNNHPLSIFSCFSLVDFKVGLAIKEKESQSDQHAQGKDNGPDMWQVNYEWPVESRAERRNFSLKNYRERPCCWKR